MRHICIYMMAGWMWAASSSVLFAQNENSYLPSIGIRQEGVAKLEDRVELKMSVDLSNARIRTQHTVALTPVLVSADGSREAAFPPMVVDGKTRHKVYLRAQHLESVALPPFHNDSAQVIVCPGKQGRQYDYVATVPYERWMLGGQVEIREEVHGCINCGVGRSAQPLLGKVLPVYVPDYRTDVVAPEPEPVKVRAETRTARLQFRQGGYQILPELNENRSELDTVSHSIEWVKTNPDVTITGIYITGYASPEGRESLNRNLSENRAKALADYIRRHEGLSPDLLHVDWKGEDWNGLVQALGDEPDLPQRDEVLEVIKRYSDDKDVCEAQLRKLLSATAYQGLLNEVYPLLRRNEYRIEYNVRNFSLDEARRMVFERPDLLSLSEMFQVADSYGKGTVEYDRVMATALHRYPDSPAVLNEHAVNAISRGEHARAVELLGKSEVTNQSAELLTTLGVAYAGAGQYEKAEDALRRASEMGSEAARHNLKEVKRVMEQM